MKDKNFHGRGIGGRKGAGIKRTGGGLSVGLLFGFFVLGFITGAVVWSRTYTDSQIRSFLLSFRDYCNTGDFWHSFAASALSELIYFGILILAAFFAFGWLAVFSLVFVRGMGLGVCICCLCYVSGIKCTAICIAAVAVPSVISVGALLFAARESVRMSGEFMLRLSSKMGGNRIGNYFIRTAFWGAVMLVAECAQTVLCRMAVTACTQLAAG